MSQDRSPKSPSNTPAHSRSNAANTGNGISMAPAQKKADAAGQDAVSGTTVEQSADSTAIQERFILQRHADEDHPIAQKKAFMPASHPGNNVVQRTVWTYNGTKWMPDNPSDMGKKARWPEHPKEGDIYDDAVEAEAPSMLPGAAEASVRSSAPPPSVILAPVVPSGRIENEEKKADTEEIDAVAHAAPSSGLPDRMTVLVTPFDGIDNVDYRGQKMDAALLEKADLTAWIAAAGKAVDKFDTASRSGYITMEVKRNYINKNNTLRGEEEKIKRLIDAPYIKRRKPADIEAAKALIQRELPPLAEDNWLGLDAQQYAGMVRHIQAIIDEPIKMDQGDYPICGPDVLLRNIAIYKPIEYAHYILGLVRDQKGQLGKKKFDLKESVLNKNYKDKLAAHKINPADLLAQSAIRAAGNRSAYNKIRASKGSFAKKWHAGLAGSTTINKLLKWVKEIGIADDKVSSGSYMFIDNSNADVLATINGRLNRGDGVMLAINPNIIGHDPAKGELSSAKLYRHWVTLTTPFEKSGTHWSATTETWGKTKTLGFRNNEISKSILGYLAVDFSSLPDTPIPQEMAIVPGGLD